jgi:hypothetical protein
VFTPTLVREILGLKCRSEFQRGRVGVNRLTVLASVLIMFRDVASEILQTATDGATRKPGIAPSPARNLAMSQNIKGRGAFLVYQLLLTLWSFPGFYYPKTRALQPKAGT